MKISPKFDRATIAAALRRPSATEGVRLEDGAEKMALEERDHVQHGKVLDRLEQQLQGAYDDSRLPEEPTTAVALDQFVVDLRLKAAGALG